MSGIDDSIKAQLAAFLDEDLGRGDVTSEALVDETRAASAHVIARESGVVAGIDEALALCEIASVHAEACAPDGSLVESGAIVIRMEGTARAILGVERTLLNLLSHMSGVATMTRRAIDAVREAVGGGKPAPMPPPGPPVAGARPPVPRITATRKTLPGLRAFEKRAVGLGGGWPHRCDLSEAVLIKDNHLAIAGDVDAAVERARDRLSRTSGNVAGHVDRAGDENPAPHDAEIEIEVESLDEAMAAAAAGAGMLLLDNMAPNRIREVVAKLEAGGVRDQVVLEASGGITIDNVRDYATSGVDLISMGSLTASARYLDFSLEVDAA